VVANLTQQVNTGVDYAALEYVAMGGKEEGEIFYGCWSYGNRECKLP